MDNGQKDAAPEDRSKRRGPRKATPRHLENAALWYLTRFQATAQSLERMLMKRVRRSAQHHGTDPEEGRAVVTDLIDRYRRAGLLDDAAYARARALTLHQRGLSLRLIRARLSEKGVPGADIDGALAELAEELADEGEPDLIAARRYARRRRLGPWRPEAQRQERRDKDLAALARAGFSYDIARTVLDGTEDTG